MAESFRLQPPISSPPDAIERALDRLWRGAAADGQAQVIRSVTMNLAVVTTPACVDEAARAVAALAERHPGRLFLIALSAAAEPRLETAVSAWCHTLAGGPPVCCEEVRIDAGGAAIEALPSLVLGALVPDVPLVVWWYGAEPSGRLFERLHAMADRSIIDSGAVGCGAAARLGGVGTRHSVRDLAWGRLTCWRELAAQLFDSPRARGYLGRIDRVHLEVSGGAATAEVLLWLGWLAACLEWQPVDGGRIDAGCRFTFRRAPDAATIEAQVISTAGPPFAIERVRFGVGADPHARFELQRAAAHATSICAPQAAQAAAARTVAIQRDAVALLSDEIEFRGRDRVYEDAMHVAVHLAAMIAA